MNRDMASEKDEIRIGSVKGDTPVRLLELVLQRDNLFAALKQAKRNKGAPGIDEMTVEELPKYLKEHWPAIKAELLGGQYVPTPVERTEIPKPSGGKRPLGIPTVVDRVRTKAPAKRRKPQANCYFPYLKRCTEALLYCASQKFELASRSNNS